MLTFAVPPKLGQPPDEVGAYTTKATRSGGKSIPGMALVESCSSSSSKKKSNCRAANAKVESGIVLSIEDSSVSCALQDLSINEHSITTQDDKHNQAASASSSMAASDLDATGAMVDTQKRVKALRKKLRDIEGIEQRPAELLTPEQRDKMAKKASIEAELNILLSSDRN